MKALLISIKPKYVALEINGLKKIEVRNTAPKDWKDYLNGKTKEMPKPIDVYIYCTKGKEESFIYPGMLISPSHYKANGKVVAKFTLNKVEMITYDSTYKLFKLNDVLQNSCLEEKELFDYLKGKVGYAWHISDLKILDIPREISEFCGTKQYFIGCESGTDKTPRYAQLTKAPQSWCYVEVLQK